MSQTLTAKPSVIQFLGNLIAGKKKVLIPLTTEEEIEMLIFYKMPDLAHPCYIEMNYRRFGILESIRRKGYIYQDKESRNTIYYRLAPEHQM
jgi:hypothetical protein